MPVVIGRPGAATAEPVGAAWPSGGLRPPYSFEQPAPPKPISPVPAENAGENAAIAVFDARISSGKKLK